MFQSTVRYSKVLCCKTLAVVVILSRWCCRNI